LKLNSIGSESYAAKLIIPSSESKCSILNEFIGNNEVKILSDLCVSKVDSTSIVIGWYHSVYEGVDMWYPNDNYCNEPRLCSLFVLIYLCTLFVLSLYNISIISLDFVCR
jgi:hypothetical protein